MLFRKILFALFLLVCAAPAFAQTATTGNAWVSAQVDSMTGQVTVKAGGKFLSYPGMSFLGLRIDGKYYSNNVQAVPGKLADPIGSGTAQQLPDVLLDNGTTTVIAGRIKTVWFDTANAIYIEQDVYPVQFAASGQIVISVLVTSTAGHAVQGQYLLDNQADVEGNPNILNSNGYDARAWQLLQGASLPSFFLEMQGTPVSPATIGMCDVNDSFAPTPMGLTQPSIVYHCDWDVVSDYTFGAPMQGSNASDMATLIQWPSLNSKPGSTEIFRFSLGTTEAKQCSGNAVAYNFLPSHIVWDDVTETYSPNPFNVLSLVFNPSGSTITNIKATQTANAPVHFWPSATIAGTQLAPNAAAAFLWRDSVDAISGCPGGTTQATLQFDASGTGLGTPAFGNCAHQIAVDCPPAKTHRPLSSVTSLSGSFDGSACNAKHVTKVAFDTGSPKLDIKSIAVTASQNMRVLLPPFFGSDSVRYSVDVIDSLLDGLAVITITDSGNVSSRDTTHYCTIADIAKPVVTAETTGPGQYSIVVTDSAAWARGINTIDVTDTLNVVVSPSTHIAGNCAPAVNFTIARREQSIYHALVRVTDCAGNQESLSIFGAEDGVNTDPAAHTIRVYPNPTTDAFTLELPDLPTPVTIVDMMGRTVAKFTGQGIYQFDVRDLLPGTYFIHSASFSIPVMRQ